MSTTFTLTADAMTKQALQLCGLVPLGRTPKNDMLQDARDILSTILKSLQARGVTLTQMTRRTLTLTAGTESYALPSTAIDVDFPTTVQEVGSTSETWVERMSYGDWRIISDKTTQGIPTRAYVEKLSSLTVFFWTIPDRSYTWNYRTIELLPDMSSGSTTNGLTQRWLGALVWRQAYWLAHAYNLPMQKRLELKTEAESQEQQVLGQENGSVDLNLSLPMDPYRSY